MNDTIGVIGLGTMGIGIAGHLLDERMYGEGI